MLQSAHKILRQLAWKRRTCKANKIVKTLNKIQFSVDDRLSWASFCAIKKCSLALEKATIALMPLFLDSACSFSYHVWYDYFQRIFHIRTLN